MTLSNHYDNPFGVGLGIKYSFDFYGWSPTIVECRGGDIYIYRLFLFKVVSVEGFKK